MSVTTYSEELKQIFKERNDLKETLFRRCYLFTNKKINCLDSFPFYNNWKEYLVGKYYLYVHKDQTCYIKNSSDKFSIIIGHAYNPFDMKYDENDLCDDLLTSFSNSTDEYFDKISEFTGMHVIFLIENNKIIVCQDACSFTGCYFGKINNDFYIAEQPQIIADLCDLKINPTIDKLICSKCYNVGNKFLPGNETPYSEVKRFGANTYLLLDDNEFSINRFYPKKPHIEIINEEDKVKYAKEIGELVHNSIDCCSKKWKKCAISLTGGTDSKTTLACANGLYDKFNYFSFYSKPQELVDAKAASKICNTLGLKHKTYKIPENNSDVKDFEILKKILQHNTSYFMNLSDHEIRKYIFLYKLDAYDIELKSYASEVGRAYMERRYNLNLPKILNERHCSIFQIRYFGHPSLLKWSDNIYKKYMKLIKLDIPPFNYEHTDLFYWEIRMGAWGVTVFSSQNIYHPATVPMNNRKILDMLLFFPHEERVKDIVHKRIMLAMNEKIVNANVEVENLYHGGKRIWMERFYYLYRTLFYRSKN